MWCLTDWTQLASDKTMCVDKKQADNLLFIILCKKKNETVFDLNVVI